MSQPLDQNADPQPTAEPADLSFEQILERLGHVVDKLEGGDIPLESSLTLFEEGVRLSRAGARRLDDAERRIEVLLSSDGELQRRPFDPEAAR